MLAHVWGTGNWGGFPKPNSQVGTGSEGLTCVWKGTGLSSFLPYWRTAWGCSSVGGCSRSIPGKGCRIKCFLRGNFGPPGQGWANDESKGCLVTSRGLSSAVGFFT